MAIGLIIIGDEIMSGKRSDKHFLTMIDMLAKRELQLDWAEYLGDNPDRIVATLRRTFSSEDIVFCCGGIGSTPDDHTRKCASIALGVPLVLHPEAKEKIYERIAEVAKNAGKAIDLDAPDNIQRLKMGEFPEGSKIIPNPVNRIPGFSVGTHYFMPGFPEMVAPMMEWALETYHSALFHQIHVDEKSLLVFGAAEAMMTPLMEEIEKSFPLIKIFSLPHIANAKSRAYVELGVKGDMTQLQQAFEKLQEGLKALQAEYQLA